MKMSEIKEKVKKTYKKVMNRFRTVPNVSGVNIKIDVGTINMAFGIDEDLNEKVKDCMWNIYKNDDITTISGHLAAIITDKKINSLLNLKDPTQMAYLMYSAGRLVQTIRSAEKGVEDIFLKLFSK